MTSPARSTRTITSTARPSTPTARPSATSSKTSPWPSTRRVSAPASTASGLSTTGGGSTPGVLRRLHDALYQRPHSSDADDAPPRPRRGRRGVHRAARCVERGPRRAGDHRQPERRPHRPQRPADHAHRTGRRHAGPRRRDRGGRQRSDIERHQRRDPAPPARYVARAAGARQRGADRSAPVRDRREVPYRARDRERSRPPARPALPRERAGGHGDHLRGEDRRT